MPRPRIDIFWRDRIKELTEQGPQKSGRQIAVLLEEQAQALGRKDWPSEKTVRNVMAEHRAASEQERRQYSQVFWPESFVGNPDLPWEAAPVVLEAVRLCGDENRPTVRTAKWLWRLTLAVPGTPPAERLKSARQMAAVEASNLPGVSETWRGVEWRLAHPGMTPPQLLSVMTTVRAAIAEGVVSQSVGDALNESRQKPAE